MIFALAKKLCLYWNVCANKSCLWPKCQETSKFHCFQDKMDILAPHKDPSPLEIPVNEFSLCTSYLKQIPQFLVYYQFISVFPSFPSHLYVPCCLFFYNSRSVFKILLTHQRCNHAYNVTGEFLALTGGRLSGKLGNSFCPF
ncbi:hypothetical protein V8G54_008299 [Vigna mungo]|uniref:Uncharacterized protein n=1 Tax=Vigna mungo TaxID=3915 RepID=A0AAQ3P5H1_VIGMU